MVIQNPDIHLLVVEPDPVDQLALKRAMRMSSPELRITYATSYDEAVAALHGGGFSLVYCEYFLGNHTAIDLVAEFVETPFVVASGSTNVSLAVESLKAGAYDYLVKDLDRSYLNVLPFTIRKVMQTRHNRFFRRLLTRAVESATDLMAVTDLEDRFIYVNPAFERTFRYKLDDLRERSIRDLVPESDLEAFLSLDEGQVAHIQMRRADDSRFPVSVSRSVLTDNEGHPDAVIRILRDETEAIRIRKALRQTESRLDDLLNSLDDVVHFTDTDGNFVYANKAIETLTGYPLDAVKKDPKLWQAIVHGADMALLEQAGRATLEKGRADYEYRILRADGETRWLRTRSVRRTDPETGGIRIEGITSDITQRKQAEQASRENAQKYSTAILNSVDAVYMLDPATWTVVESNPAFRELLGYADGETIGLPVTEFIMDEMEGIRSFALAIIDSGGRILGERQWRRKDGEVVDVRVSASPVRQGDRELIFVVGHDIGQQKRYQQALERERLLLREIVKNTPVPIAMLDEELRFVTWSDSWVRTYGPRRANLEKRRMEDVYPFVPEDWLAYCRNALAGIAHQLSETELTMPDGTTASLRLAVHPWSERPEIPKGIVIVAERIDELVCSRKEAESANEAKSGFLARITHELRTPLNAILGFSQILLKDKTLPETHQRHVDTMYRSGLHLLRMINDILDLSKIEASRMELRPEPMNLLELTRDLEDLFRGRCQDKQVGLEIHGSDLMWPYVIADRGKFDQILINLVGNAVKFTDSGTVRVAMSERPEPHTGRSIIRVEVADTGRGIPEDQLASIFEPFVQARNTSGQGTGLGLAITRKLVELMGGTIRVTSQLDVGSTFTIEIPVLRADTMQARVDTPYARVEGILSPKPFRVLVVDDIDHNRQVARLRLEQVGITIEEAVNGQDAIMKTLTFKPHAVLMDIVMPVMDGQQAMREIRQLPGGTDIPIIALTASGLDDRREELIASGFSAYILKPFRDTEIFEALANLAGLRFQFGDETDSDPHPTNEGVLRESLTRLDEPIRQQLADALATQDLEEIDRLGILLIETEAHIELGFLLRQIAEDVDFIQITRLHKWL